MNITYHPKLMGKQRLLIGVLNNIYNASLLSTLAAGILSFHGPNFGTTQCFMHPLA